MRRGIILACAVVLLLAGVGVWWSIRPVPAPFQWSAWTPREAEAVVWVDRLADVRTGLRRLTTALPGTQGLRDALQLTAGLDLLDPDAPTRAGLRDDAGLVAFQWQGALWLAVPVRNESGAAHLLKLLADRGYQPTAQADQQWSLADRAHGEVAAAHAWLRDDVMLLRTGSDAAAAYKSYLAAPRLTPTAFGARSGPLHAHLALTPPTLALIHEAVGPGNLLIGAAIDKLVSLDADLRVTPTPSLHVRTTSAPGALADVARFHSGFLPDVAGAMLDVGELLPDETPVVVRGRINPAMLQMIPETVRDRFLPASLLAHLHPALAGVDARLQLLQVWDGQVAIAGLGIADSVPLDPRAWPQLSWRTALRLAVAVSLRTDQDAASLLDRVRSALDQTSERSQAIQLGAWTGLQVPGPESPWLLLKNGRQVALVSGPGETEDLQRTASGKFPSLAKAARGELEQSVVQGKQVWIGALATTPRLVRSLRRRGMPDYIVQLLASISAISAGVTLEPDAITLDVQLRPARYEAP